MNREIKDLISKYLIKDVDIDEIYKKIVNYKEGDKTIELDKEKLQSFYDQWSNNFSDFQIDLPFWVQSNENKKKIMIIGQDANNSGKENSEKIKINTPYSYHSNENNDYKKILDKLKIDYNLYLTDLYKLFFWYKNTIFNTPVAAKSHQFPNYINDEIHYKILLEEINLIRPDLIVTFGNNARNAISLISKEPINFKNLVSKDNLKKGYNFVLDESFTIKFAPIPHPSNATRQSAWVSFFEANKIEKNMDRTDGAVEIINGILK